MADPHNHTHQRRHTRQHTPHKTTWATLAITALIATVLAVAATPANAAPVDPRTTADALPDRTACLGPALADAGFTDVGMGTHDNNINCLAYYGITTGTSATTYDPRGNVTRSQMALFLHRMATVAGVELDDAMDAGYTDLNGIADTRINAINRLANAGIFNGRTKTTFEPLAHVTRAEMAVALVNFMAYTTSSSSPVNVKVNKDGTYTIEAIDDDDAIALDHFGDARSTQPRHVDSAISAAFELGITTGYADSTFKPDQTVSRAEMASFITRALAHSNTRPKGITAQRAGNSIQVSVRDADFKPEPNIPVDVFGTAFEDDAFEDADGSCVQRFIDRFDVGSSACKIDVLDLVTDDAGNAAFDGSSPADPDPIDTVMCGTAGEFPTGIGDKDREADDLTIWAWTGQMSDTVDDETDLFEVIKVSGSARKPRLNPHHAEITGGLDDKKNEHEARFGQTVNYILQLHADKTDEDTGEHVPTAPDHSGNRYTLVTTHSYLKYETVADQDDDNDITTAGVEVKRRADTDSGTNGVQHGADTARTIAVSTQVIAPDSDGKLVIPITQADPHPNTNWDDMIVNITVTPFGLDPTADNYNGARGGGLGAFDDGEGGYMAMFADDIIFSDDGVDPNRVAISVAGPTGAPVSYAEAPGRGTAQSRVTITVVDQYGRPVNGFNVNAVSDQDGDDGEGTSTLPYVKYYTTRSQGSYTIGYSYTGGAGTEMLTAFGAIRHTVRLTPPEDDQGNAIDVNRDGTTDNLDGRKVSLLPERNTNTDDEGAKDPELEAPTEEAPSNVAFNVIFPDATKSDEVDFWSLLLPGSTKADKPFVTMHWADTGQTIASDSAYTYRADNGNSILVADVANATFVVQEADGTPEMYEWDDADRFILGNTPVDRDVFEAVVTAAVQTPDPTADPRERARNVTGLTLSWRSYDYRRAADRAVWTINATCEPSARPTSNG